MHWNQLVKLALLGTNRTNLPDTLVEELKEIGIVEDDPAALVLKGAATMSMMKKAGQRTSVFEGQLPTPADLDKDQSCSKRAIWYLQTSIKQKQPNTIIEFLEMMDNAQKVLPPEVLPVLLNQSLESKELWEAVAPVLGVRGYWLMSIHPQWKNLHYIPDSSHWEYGDLSTRIKYLSSLRLTNPSEGLKLLMETWSEENTTNRKKLLDVLSIGLQENDASFLEACLQEKQKSIREVAIDLQTRLLNSPLNQRMQKRLTTFLQFNQEKKELIVELPRGVDSDMIRDGILASTQVYRSGTHASQLAQMLQRFPPKLIEELSGQDASPTIKIIAKNKDYGHLILMSLVDAAAHHNNQEWLELIFQHWMTNYESTHWQPFSALKLMNHLSAKTFNTLSIEALKKCKDIIPENSPADLLLQNGQQPWSDELTKNFIQQLQSWLTNDHLSYWGEFHIRKMLKRAAGQINPDLYPTLQKGWPEHLPIWGGWERDVMSFLGALQLRYKMRKALKE